MKGGDLIMGYMLTTTDNPFDPTTQWDEWFMEDHRLGHNTCERLFRMALTSDAFGDDLNRQIIDEAMTQIILLDPLHIYRRVPIK